MATSKEYLHFILDQLSGLTEITYRCAFGEYMIYYCGKVAAYLCDDRLLVKPVPSAVRMMPGARYEPPYEGAKEMLLVENVDDREFLAVLFTAMHPELPEPKKKRTKKSELETQ
ncbi:MAG: competence protein TfoX [Lachnospiraceae bacterium]|nr:competence protein TfoX [Lachnospiraceae bacterium]